MEIKEKKPVSHIIRVLHRNTGFFILGFVLIYALSGITLIYRDSDFLKHEKTVITMIPVETNPTDLGQVLKIREFKLLKTEGDIVYFQGGSFNTATGEAVMSVKELVFPINKLASLHKTPSKNPFHWFNLAFGIIMLFMAISSLWMFNKKSKIFRNGIIMVLSGFIFAVVVILFLK